MTATKATTNSASADAAPATPAEFVMTLEHTFAQAGAFAASAYFVRYHGELHARFSESERTRLEEVMHIVDTATGWEPPASSRAVTILPED